MNNSTKNKIYLLFKPFSVLSLFMVIPAVLFLTCFDWMKNILQEA